MRLTLVSLDPEPPEAPVRWQVRLDALLSDDSVRHCPVTVYRSQLPDDSRASILAAADAMVRPGLTIEEARLGAPPAPDWSDARESVTEERA